MPEFTPGRAQVTTTTMMAKSADRYADGYWVDPPVIQPSHTLGGLRPDWVRAYRAPDAIDWELPGTTGTRVSVVADGTIVTPDHLCPDLLRLSNIGPAEGWRGRVVRGFFQIMRLWPPKGTR